MIVYTSSRLLLTLTLRVRLAVKIIPEVWCMYGFSTQFSRVLVTGCSEYISVNYTVLCNEIGLSVDYGRFKYSRCSDSLLVII